MAALELRRQSGLAWICLAFLVLTVSPLPVAYAERASQSIMSLHRAPYQLEVTVMELTEQASSAGRTTTTTYTYRVRVDRVLHGEDIAAGDEVAVTSSTHSLAPGTVGGSGDRSVFQGPKGLPLKGDRARLFATRSRGLFVPESPNGWQPSARSVAVVVAGGSSDDRRAAESIAAGLPSASVTPVLFDVSLATERADGQWHAMRSSSLWSSEGIIIAAAEPLGEEEAREVLQEACAGMPLVALGPTAAVLKRSPAIPCAPGRVESPTSQTLLGVAEFRGVSSRSLRVVGGEGAGSEFADLVKAVEGSKVELQVEGEVPAGLSSDCRVLLSGVAGTDGTGERVPLLWVRELPRRVMERVKGEEKELTLPAQRVVGSIASLEQIGSHPSLEALVRRCVTWSVRAE